MSGAWVYCPTCRKSSEVAAKSKSTAACPHCGKLVDVEPASWPTAEAPSLRPLIVLATVAAVGVMALIGGVAGLALILYGRGAASDDSAATAARDSATPEKARILPASRPAGVPPVEELLKRDDLIPNHAGRLRYNWQADRNYRYLIEIEAGQEGKVEQHRRNVTYTVAADDGPLAAIQRKLMAEGTTGSGFVVHGDGYLITCAHVVKGATRLQVFLGGEQYEGVVVAYDEPHDLAVVHIDDGDLPALALARDDQIELGQEVQTIAYPLTDDVSEGVKVTKGAVSGHTLIEDRRFVQVDAAMNPGASGGPVVDSSGAVIGVAAGQMSNLLAQNVNFAVASEDVGRLLKRCGIHYRDRESAAPRPTVEVVKQVRPSVALLKVTAGPGGVALPRRFALDCSYSAPRGEEPKRSLLPRVFLGRAHQTGKLLVDEFGQVHSDAVEEDLPQFLGPIAQAAVPPLPPVGETSWSEESARLVPLQVGLRTRFLLGRESSSFELGDQSGDRVTIKKSYQLRVPGDEKLPAQLTVRGEGEFVFDVEQGVVTSYSYTARRENVAAGKPPIEITARLTLLSESATEVAASPSPAASTDAKDDAGEPSPSSSEDPFARPADPEPAIETPRPPTVTVAKAEPPDAQPAGSPSSIQLTEEPQSSPDTEEPPSEPVVLSEDEVRRLIVESSRLDEQGIRAMHRLAQASPVERYREFVIRSVYPVVQRYTRPTSGIRPDRGRTAAAIDVLGVWGNSGMSRTLQGIIERETDDDQTVLRAAVRAICRLKEDELLVRLLDPEHPAYNGGRSVNALSWAGEAGESALLRLAAGKDHNVQLRALWVLRHVGRQKSVDTLREIADSHADDPSFRARILAVQREVAANLENPNRPRGDIVKVTTDLPARSARRPGTRLPVLPRPRVPRTARPGTPPTTPPRVTASVPEPAPMHRLEVFRTPQLRWGIKSLAFSPDGKYLAVGKMDRKLLMFDVEKGAAVATIDDLRAISSISSLAFTHDGAKLVAGGSTGIIHCYAVGDDGDLGQTGSFAGHASEIHCLAVSPDNRLVLSGDQDKRLRCWSLESCREQWVIADFTGRAQAVCFTKEGAEGLVTDGKMLLRIDLDSGTVMSSRKIAGFSHSSAFSPDGQYVSTCDGRTIRTFDTSTAKELSVCETDEIQWAMCSSPDGKQLAAGGNNLLSIVEVESGKRVAALPLAGIGYSHAVAWSADGRYAAGIGQSQRIASVFAVDKLDQRDAESP